ncbi:hypothetical protein BDFB_000271 [Asbolus verrucosus]|uniref:Uncharacterized protein n=1 Tax=Asbolus verrucosus TaxID=1661398 RepID=A0A482W4Z3_ASBVE|nr:hypothetical protein BDFB_000271 [Asbolus verrucosus]
MTDSHEVLIGFILAPEVPNSFQTTSRGGVLSRSNSGDPEEKQTRSEIHSSLDTIHLRSRPISLVEEQGVFFSSYSKRNTFRNECIEEVKDYESYSSRHYSTQFDHSSWRYKHQIPSEHYQATNRDFGGSDYLRTRYQFREQPETNRLDYLSLSLSPPTRCKELSSYAHESLSL